MAKTKKVLSLFLVALMTVFTVLSYVPAKAATAAPKLAVVTQPAAEYTPDQTISFTVNAHYAGKVMYRVILYNGTTKLTSNLWNTPKTGYYYTKWTPSGTMNFDIHWSAKQLQEGFYSMTVLAKRVGSKAKYDTYVDTKSFEVKSGVATIASIADVTASVDENAAYTLPATVSATMSDKTTKDVAVVWTPATVDTSKAGIYTFTGKVEGYDKDVKLTLTVNAVALTVKSISVVNAKQIAITFSKPVDPYTVLDPVLDDGTLIANVVKIDGTNAASLATGEFDDTNTVLTLTISTSQWAKDQIYVISVNGVKDTLANAVPAYAQAIKMAETVAPSVSKITSKTNSDTTKTIAITFSEPVTFYSIKVNNKYAQIANTDSGFGAAYTLTAVDDLSVGTNYAIEINGLKDLLGNTASNITATSVTPVKDATKPTFTLTAKSETKFNVVFNKTMSSTVPVDAVSVKVANADGTYLALPLACVPSRNSDKVSYKVTLASVPFATYENSKEIIVTVKNCVDTLGNVMDAATAKVTLTRDTVKPTVVSAAQKPGTQNQINLTLSEPVTLADGTAFETAIDTKLDAAIKITDANGNLVKPDGVNAITVTGATALDSSNITTLTLSAALPTTGSYKVVIMQSSLKDNAAVANYNDAQIATLSFSKDTTVISPVNATIVAKTDATGATATDSSASNRKVTVKFDQLDVVNGLDVATGTYKAGAADNPANYALDGAALPKGAKVTFVNNDLTNNGKDTAIIDLSAVTADYLPTAFANGGDIAVSVNNIKTISGATLSYTTLLVTVKDVTRPALKAAYLTGNATSGYTLTVIFSEKMSVVNATELQLTDGTTNYGFIGKSATIDSSDTTRATISLSATELAGLNLTKALKLTMPGTTFTTADKATVANTAAQDTTGVSIINYAQ